MICALISHHCSIQVLTALQLDVNVLAFFLHQVENSHELAHKGGELAVKIRNADNE